MARSFLGAHIDAPTAAGYSEQVAYSVSFWVKAASSSTATQEVYCETNSASANANFQLRSSGSAGHSLFVIIRNNAGGSSQINGTATALAVFDNTWHQAIYAQDASGHWQVYVDGAADSTAHGTFTTGATTINRLTVGAFLNGGAYTSGLTGSVQEVAVFHRQLTAGEAKSLGSGLPASFLNPVHYWPLWGKDSPEPDIGTGTHATGTLTGTSYVNGGRVSPRLLTV